jgi:cell division septation protein DedD
MPEVFTYLAMADIAALLQRASRLAVIASPGIDEAIASALVNTADRIGIGNVHVILDVDEENCRAGYGNVDGYSVLAEKGIPIRRATGLRIGFVLSDEEGFIFGMPPLMIEAPSKLAGCPNAIRTTADQIKALIAATVVPAAPPQKPAEQKPEEEHKPEQPNKDDEPDSIPPAAALANSVQIGATLVSSDEVRQIEENIRANPIRDFDLGRVVTVFNAHVQFVELSVEGASIERHTVKLPSELLTAVRDKETRDRLTAAFKMISEGSKISGENIRAKANDIRKRYIRTNSTYGGVVLKAKSAALEKEIEDLRRELDAHKVNVRQRFLKEADKSKKELVQAFWRAVRASPPPDLQAQISADKPTMEEAKAYLEETLERAFPDVEEVCGEMKVKYLTKDVTWNTLNDSEFVDWLAKEFRVNKDLKKPFEEYRAARQRAVGPAQGVLNL